MPDKDIQRARFYVASLWGMAGIAVGLMMIGGMESRELELGAAILIPVGLILYLITWRDRGGHWLLIPFVIFLAFSEGGWSAAGLPTASSTPVMIIVAWAATAFIIGERLRRIGWFAP